MSEQEHPEGKGPGPLEVMGLFWIALGIIMVIAVYAPETKIGQVVNLAAGLVLLAVGLVAYTAGRKKRLKGDGESA